MILSRENLLLGSVEKGIFVKKEGKVLGVNWEEVEEVSFKKVGKGYYVFVLFFVVGLTKVMSLIFLLPLVFLPLVFPCMMEVRTKDGEGSFLFRDDSYKELERVAREKGKLKKFGLRLPRVSFPLGERTGKPSEG